MKFDFKTIIILIMALGFVAVIILWPKKEDSAAVKNARDSVARLLEANTINSMHRRTAELALIEFKANKKSDSTRFVREITVKNQQLAKKRVRIDTVFKDNEVVQDYLQTADSVFAMMRERIDTLEQNLQFQASLYNELIFVKTKETTNLNMIITQKDIVIKDLEKQARKKRRGAKFWKAAAVTLGVVGVVVGSQL